MESAIHIGAKIDKDSYQNLAEFVERTFKAGRENGMDQSTISTALQLFSKTFQPKNICISNCSIVNEQQKGGTNT